MDPDRFERLLVALGQSIADDRPIDRCALVVNSIDLIWPVLLLCRVFTALRSIGSLWHIVGLLPHLYLDC